MPAGKIKKAFVIPLCQWIFVAWQCISPEETVEGFKSALYPLQWMGLLMMHNGMTVKRM